MVSMMSMIEDVYCFVAQLEDFTEGHVQSCDVNEVNDRRCVLFCSTVRRLFCSTLEDFTEGHVQWCQ